MKKMIAVRINTQLYDILHDLTKKEECTVSKYVVKAIIKELIKDEYVAESDILKMDLL